MTREEAINAITQFIENYAYGNDLIGLKMAIEALKEDRPHGEWIVDKIFGTVKCPMCSCEIVPNNMLNGEANFCPNCGSDNRKKEGDEK